MVTAEGVPKLLDFGIARLALEGAPDAERPAQPAGAHADARLREPGSGARRAGDDRGRRLRARRAALRAPHRRAPAALRHHDQRRRSSASCATSRREPSAAAREPSDRIARAATERARLRGRHAGRPARAPRGRPRRDHRQGAAQGADQALRVGRGARRRPAPPSRWPARGGAGRHLVLRRRAFRGAPPLGRGRGRAAAAGRRRRCRDLLGAGGAPGRGARPHRARTRHRAAGARVPDRALRGIESRCARRRLRSRRASCSIAAPSGSTPSWPASR